MYKEEEAIALCKEGNRAAFTELYNQHSGSVYSSIVRLIKNTAEAEDILQESFVTAFRGLHNYKPTGGFRAWVKKIAINKSIDSIRKRKLSFIDIEVDHLHLKDDFTTNEFEFRYNMDLIEKAIESLPDNYRTVFLLFAVEDIPQAEIAQKLGLKNELVRVQYHRAKQKLLSILKKDYYYAE